MEFLHCNNIIHRDLKPENILLNDYFFPKISDFGLSKIFDPNIRSNQTMHSATPQYMAPEMLKNEDYNESVDVFSFGIIMYDIITEKYPYSNISNCFVIPHLVLKGCRLEFPLDKKIYPKIKELIEKCWSQNPSNRPSFRRFSMNLKMKK